MTAGDATHPHGPEFERFLYASVGENRNGDTVTVLSTLARLNLDPWQEAADLSDSGGDAARSRLRLLLARVRDVPALVTDHRTVAQDLVQLLPSRQAGAAQWSQAQTGRTPIPWGAILAALAVLVFTIRMLFPGSP